MRIDATQAALVIFVSGACTFFLRAIPFLLFGGKKYTPVFLTELGVVLPPAIMAVLVVYCLKDVMKKPLIGSVPEIISAVLVILIHSWRKNTILSVLCGTACYMIVMKLLV